MSAFEGKDHIHKAKCTDLGVWCSLIIGSIKLYFPNVYLNKWTSVAEEKAAGGGLY